MSIKCKHVTCQCDDPKDATIARLTREWTKRLFLWAMRKAIDATK